MENQCVESPTRDGACDYQEYEDQDMGYADLQIPAKTREEVCTCDSCVNLMGKMFFL